MSSRKMGHLNDTSPSFLTAKLLCHDLIYSIDSLSKKTLVGKDNDLVNTTTAQPDFTSNTACQMAHHSSILEQLVWNQAITHPSLCARRAQSRSWARMETRLGLDMLTKPNTFIRYQTPQMQSTTQKKNSPFQQHTRIPSPAS